MNLRSVLILSAVSLLPGLGQSDIEGINKVTAIEHKLVYGESLDSVERKLKSFGINFVVVPSLAIDPEVLRKKFGMTVTAEEAERMPFYGIDLTSQLGIGLAFNREKKLVEFERFLNARKDQYGKSIRQVFKLLPGISGNTGDHPQKESGGSVPQDKPPLEESGLIPRIEDSVRFGESPDDVAAKLKALGLNPIVVASGFTTPQEIQERGIEISDAQKDQVSFYRIEMTESLGVAFYFNFYNKLFRYQNTHLYDREMDGKVFFEVQAKLEAKLERRRSP